MGYPVSSPSLKNVSSKRETPEIGSQANMEKDRGMLAKYVRPVNRTWLKIPRLQQFREMAEWQQDNEYIISSYRPTSGSAWISFASLLYLHNETINIHSHLLGSIAFCVLPFAFYHFVFQFQPNAHIDDLIVISIYCLGVAVCFAFSAIFHIMCNHSQPMASFCNKLDYLGILVLMWAAGIPTIYYGFFCNPILRLLYWMATSSTALCCTIITLHPRFISRQFRRWRACFYAAFGLSSIVYIIHGLLIYGWKLQSERMSLSWMGWMATSNLVGAAIYTARAPERWVPYKFDVYGASHQILHTSVITAAVIHFCGLLKAFSIIRSQDNTCVDQ